MLILEDIKLLKTTINKTEANSAVFLIEPFFPGYGVTIGHTLRRILLSSLQGSAITDVRIQGANHEFTTINGVKEDVVDIILNLKQLAVKSYSEEPVSLKLNKKGPGTIKASDFSKNSQIEILEKDYIIANLDKNGKLEMEITIKQGTGYVPVEKRKDEKLPLGTIAIDAIYNPIKKISYEVLNTRVGGMTNYDKLILNITTNGSISPEEAFYKALDITIKYFSQILPKDSNNKKKKEDLIKINKIKKIKKPKKSKINKVIKNK